MNDLRQVAKKFSDKLLKIKVCAFDIDGVLTNGLIHYDGEEMGFNRSSHSRDGYGLKILMQAGFKVGVISGGDSLGVQKRFRDNLKLDFVYLGDEDKRESYNKIIAQGYKDEEILYMGDEFFDMPLLKRCGFAATVNEASYEVKEIVDYIAETPSGMGCVREVIDILRYARNIQPMVKDF